MTITRNFKLCLNAGTQNAPYINANQYDEGEEWVFDLYTEGGQKFTPSTGAIIGIKSDGNAILNSGTVNSDGQVVIIETQQMTAASGLAVFELLIEGETHGTANFIVNVERRPSDDAEFSDSDLSMLQEAIDAAEVINEILDEGGDPSEIITENVNAWLDNHPEATTTVEDGAITAPKINSTLWDKLLVSESASGAVASFDDGADDVPVSSLKVALEPVQLGSGDPSPSNIRPIVASNGKNLADFVNGYTVDASGNVVGYGTRIATVNPITIKSGVSYKVIFGGNAANAIYAVFNGSTLVRRLAGVTSGTVLDTSGGTDLYVCVYAGESTTVTVDSAYAMVVYSSIADTSYQPYMSVLVDRTGANQFDEIWESGSIASADGRNTNNTTVIRAKNYIPVYPNTQYYLSNAYGSNIYWFFYDANKTYLNAFGNGNDITVTTPPNAYYMRIRWASGYGTTYRNDTVINYPSSVTTYEPFTGTSYPYTLGQSVYGGTVDLVTGVLTVDRAYKVFDGTEQTGWGSIATYGDVRRFDYTNADILNRDSGGGVICNYLSNGAIGTSNLECCNVHAGSSIVQIQIKTSRLSGTAVADLMTYFQSNPIQLCYKLATPQTIQLTPTQVKTLLGYNNISSSGTVDVIYHADTKLYIDKKIGELS